MIKKLLIVTPMATLPPGFIYAILTEILADIVKLHHTDDVRLRHTLCKDAVW